MSHFLLGRYLCLQAVLNVRGGKDVDFEVLLGKLFSDVVKHGWSYSLVSELILS